MRRVQPDERLYRRAIEHLTAEETILGLVSAFVFEEKGTLQLLIHQLKYSGMRGVGEELGKEVGRLLQASLPGVHFDGVVPVPLHRVKQRERGYNQSVCIAQGIRSVTGIPVAGSILLRGRYTETQTKLDAEQRKENVRDAFILAPGRKSAIRGKTYLLVDDVITTGATIVSCARVLASEGAGKLYAASIALAE